MPCEDSEEFYKAKYHVLRNILYSTSEYKLSSDSTAPLGVNEVIYG